MRFDRTKIRAAFLLCSLLTALLIPPGSTAAREPLDPSQEMQQETTVVSVWMTSVLDWLSGLVGIAGPSSVSNMCVEPGCEPGTTGTPEPTGEIPTTSPEGGAGGIGEGEAGGNLDPVG